jgi:DNA uptake protein ComE-like DNA-binding protein
MMIFRSPARSFVLPLALTTLCVSSSDAQVGRNMGALNPNTATEAEMAALPHMSGAKASSIVEGRPFRNMLEVHAFVGASLTEEQQDELYSRLFLPLNLNDTTEEEVLLVPGVGARMAHEFEEYKPYAGLPVFRREIGKYVDDQEVARLEQFVFVPIDLNTASDEDIRSIPNLGNRMLHEFKEYRPYRRIEEFRREIGKYVDDDEVARLERYVNID